VAGVIAIMPIAGDGTEGNERRPASFSQIYGGAGRPLRNLIG